MRAEFLRGLEDNDGGILNFFMSVGVSGTDLGTLDSILHHIFIVYSNRNRNDVDLPPVERDFRVFRSRDGLFVVVNAPVHYFAKNEEIY